MTVNAVKTYQMLMAASILLSASTISLALSVTGPGGEAGNGLVMYGYAFAPSLALIHHVVSSLSPVPSLPNPHARESVSAPRKAITSTTNLLCLALLTIVVITSGSAVLVHAIVQFATLERFAQSQVIAESSNGTTAATGLRESFADDVLVFQALLGIVQGIIIGWMFGVAVQEARIVSALEHGVDLPDMAEQGALQCMLQGEGVDFEVDAEDEDK